MQRDKARDRESCVPFFRLSRSRSLPRCHGPKGRRGSSVICEICVICGLFSVDTTGMHRSRQAVLVVCIATLHPIAANQTVETFRVSKSNVADVNQETLQEVNPE